MAGHDDSAYAGNHMKRLDGKAFGVSSNDVEDPVKDVDVAPDLQINRRGVGKEGCISIALKKSASTSLGRAGLPANLRHHVSLPHNCN